jgi:hypothetical protein
MSNVPCSCGGSNENCRYCFGSGVRPSQLDFQSFSGPIAAPGRFAVDVKSRARRLPNSGSIASAGTARVKGCRTKSHNRSAKPAVNSSHDKLQPGAKGGFRNLTRCPRCACSIRKDRLEKHLRLVHKNNRNPSGFKAQNSQSRNDSSRLIIPDTRQEEARKERQLDGTKEYAHAFREQGKYGSHPSHDRFDDDSNP